MILFIDNYDSFTYNLVQMVEGLGREVKVVRNDQATLEEMEEMAPASLIISPGPCTPAEAGISVEAIGYFGPRIPILGVCLGHQSIAAAYGGRVVRANRIMHGKISSIFHDGGTVFHDVPSPMTATRYHSLIVAGDEIPPCLEVSAWTEQGEVMGVRHREYKVEGVQFHPESILTDGGYRIMKNFIDLNAL